MQFSLRTLLLRNGLSAFVICLALGTGSVHATSLIDDCLEAGDCKFLVWSAAHPPARMAFAVLPSVWQEFSAEDREEVVRRLQLHVEAMRKDPVRYAQSKKYGAGIGADSIMFGMLVRNIRRTSRYAVLLCRRNGGDLFVDSEVADIEPTHDPLIDRFTRPIGVVAR